jgi:hypothetical protein
MLSRALMRHISSNLIAYLALFMALGGSAYAAMSIPANSVGTKQLRGGAVTMKKIARGTQLALRGQRGPAGLTGPQGATGPEGPATGHAGGDLTGNYPDPTIAAGAVTPSTIGMIPAARATIGTDYPRDSGNQAIVGMLNLEFENATMFDHGALKAPIAGIYQIDAGIEWAANGSGNRFLAIEAGNTCCFAAAWVPAASGDLTIESTSDLLRLSAGEDVYVVASQDSGSSLRIDNSQASFLAMHWVGR